MTQTNPIYDLLTQFEVDAVPTVAQCPYCGYEELIVTSKEVLRFTVQCHHPLCREYFTQGVEHDND